MTHEANFAPKDPSVRLAEAKDDFRQLVLADDVSLAVLSEKLFDSDVSGGTYPAIAVEPTLRRDETNSYLGFRITHSSHSSADEASVSVSRYEYIGIGTVNREDGILWPSDELKGLLHSAGREIQDTSSIVQTWQRGVNGITEKMGGELTLDPYSNTFELASVVERTMHIQ